MKLSGPEGARFCAAPDGRAGAILIHGPDAALVADRRRDLVAALLGEGDTDLRLDRIAAADARRDPAMVDTALKSIGFFPGRRVVLIDQATDGLANGLKPIIPEIEPAESVLVMTADVLPGRSTLRKLIEGARNAVAISVYPEAPGRAEVARMLEAAGCAQPVDESGMEALLAAGAAIDNAGFRQLISKLALYSLGSEGEITGDEVAALAPPSGDAEIDELIAAVAGGFPERIGPVLLRLRSQGVTATGIAIALTRYFQQIHQVSCDPAGPDAATTRLRPPLFGPRKSAMISQARRWGESRAEAALRVLLETDRTLRSAGTRPDTAILERSLIRLGIMGQSARG